MVEENTKSPNSPIKLTNGAPVTCARFTSVSQDAAKVWVPAPHSIFVIEEDIIYAQNGLMADPRTK